MNNGNNKINRVLKSTLAVLLVMSFFVAGYAETRFSKTQFVKVNLTITNGVAQCAGQAKAIAVEPCYLTVRLYKLESGSWQQIRMWSAYEVDGSASVRGNCTLTESGQYKAVATSTIDDEVVSKTSQICYY